MSYNDISGHIKELFDTDISHTLLSQITDLHNHELQDILIAPVPITLMALHRPFRVYTQRLRYSFVLHQIRNSFKYLALKEQKEFMKDLKKVYRTVPKEVAEDELLNLEEKWGSNIL